MSDSLPETFHLIDGRPAPSADGSRFELRSPATGEPIARVARGSTAELDLAVAAARRAFGPWSALTAYERQRLLLQASKHARSRADAIGRLMALEQGKPLAQSVSEIGASCDTLDYFAAEAPRIEGYTNPTESAAYRSTVLYQPVGVCGLITPWNYPVSLLSWKLGPALAAGCTVVVKPTTVTPLSPTAFCQALAEGGLPPGVINVINGPGASLGEALVRHPGVAKVAMTGSTAVGKQILQAAAPYLKKVSLELGGQCPAIVRDDADLDLTAKTIAYKGFRNCGQSCSSVNRVYAHRGVHDELVRRLTVIAEGMSIGDGITDPKVDLGPMATADGPKTAQDHVDDARARGASLVTGGSRPPGEAFARGRYYRPTILTGCTPAMRVMREETFGPVIAFAAFDTDEEAVRLANDTAYGLVSYLFTRDHAATVRLSEALEAGTVCVNHGAVNTNYGPYAGWKESGYGLELSRRSVLEYLRVKHIKTAV
jgi:succinate-semialdehyde dehydrogenase / glutarate-semialdehyde dehydrogenase